uniref:Uncharacterized protein n=1 Tax=Knipowitschia caucasica TaxID=637954 RepID=A0AAV2MHN8_KNICA
MLCLHWHSSAWPGTAEHSSTSASRPEPVSSYIKPLHKATGPPHRPCTGPHRPTPHIRSDTYHNYSPTSYSSPLATAITQPTELSLIHDSGGGKLAAHIRSIPKQVDCREDVSRTPHLPVRKVTFACTNRTPTNIPESWSVLAASSAIGWPAMKAKALSPQAHLLERLPVGRGTAVAPDWRRDQAARWMGFSRGGGSQRTFRRWAGEQMHETQVQMERPKRSPHICQPLHLLPEPSPPPPWALSTSFLGLSLHLLPGSTSSKALSISSLGPFHLLLVSNSSLGPFHLLPGLSSPPPRALSTSSLGPSPPRPSPSPPWLIPTSSLGPPPPYVHLLQGPLHLLLGLHPFWALSTSSLAFPHLLPGPSLPPLSALSTSSFSAFSLAAFSASSLAAFSTSSLSSSSPSDRTMTQSRTHDKRRVEVEHSKTTAQPLSHADANGAGVWRPSMHGLAPTVYSTFNPPLHTPPPRAFLMRPVGSRLMIALHFLCRERDLGLNNGPLLISPCH